MKKNITTIAILAVIVCRFIWLTYRDSNPFLSNVADLGPPPDAVEYLLHAWKFATSGSVTFDVNGFTWPTRYPPGMMLLVAPFYFIFDRVEVVASIAPIVFAIACILVAFSVTKVMLNERVALVFAALLSTSPLFIFMSTMTMSEVPSIAFGLTLMWAVYREIRIPGPRNRMFIGLCSGALLLLKLQMAIPVLAAGMTFGIVYGPRDVRKTGEIIIPFVVVALFFLGWNWALFGKPLKTGYDFHVGNSPFAGYAWRQGLDDLGTLMRAGEFSIAGLVTRVTPVWLPAAALIGLVALWRSHGPRLALCAAAFVVLSTAPMVFYIYRDARFHSVLLVSMLLFAAIGADWVIASPLRRRIGNGAAAGLASLVLVCAPVTGSPLAFANEFATRGWRADKYMALQAMRDDKGTSEVALLSTLHPAVSLYFGGVGAKAYPLLPQCFGECAWRSSAALHPDLFEVVKHNRTYLLDADYPKADFVLLCQQIARDFDVYRLESPSRFSIYRIGWRYDRTNDCPR